MSIMTATESSVLGRGPTDIIVESGLSDSVFVAQNSSLGNVNERDDSNSTATDSDNKNKRRISHFKIDADGKIMVIVIGSYNSIDKYVIYETILLQFYFYSYIHNYSYFVLSSYNNKIK